MQSRKPPPLPSKLIKSDPDSATSPSKYSEPGSKSPVSANQKTAMPESSDAASEAGAGAKKKVFRKKMKKKKQSVVSEDEGGPPRRPKTPGPRSTPGSPDRKTPGSPGKSPGRRASKAGSGVDEPPPPPTHGVVISEAKQREAEALLKAGGGAGAPSPGGLAIAKSKQLEAEAVLKANKKQWETEKRDHLNLEIKKFMHKSKSNFMIDDIKHAMDNAKILSRTESLGHDPDDPDDR